MKPIVPLKTEHGLIDQMIKLARDETLKMATKDAFSPAFIDTLVDFLRTYADDTHHGKEEDILFRDLRDKDMSAEDLQLMEELVQEHVDAREMVRALVAAKERHLQGDREALESVIRNLAGLIELYPEHIKKEDDVFFPASMAYFTASEQKAMLEKMYEVDRQMIHRKYQSVVQRLRDQRMGIQTSEEYAPGG
ncbi:MAG: hemerythrin domain-containing protein [Chloroflexota bacterium]